MLDVIIRSWDALFLLEIVINEGFLRTFMNFSA